MKAPCELEVEALLLERARRAEADARRRASPREMVDVVARACGVDRQEIASSSRRRELVEARELLAVTAHEWCRASYPEIARLIGHRNHSTVHSAAIRFGRRPEPQRQEALGRVLAALPSDIDPPRLAAMTSRHGRGR